MDEVIKRLDKLEALTLLQAKDALNLDEASMLTGLSKSHLYKLTHRREIPYFKARDGGKCNYFSKSELTDWMLHRRIKTNDELETAAANYIVTKGRGGKK